MAPKVLSVILIVAVPGLCSGNPPPTPTFPQGDGNTSSQTTLPPNNNSQKEAEDLAEKAARLFDEGQFANAITYLSQAISMKPKPSYYDKRADCFVKEARYDEAVSDLRTLLSEYDGTSLERAKLVKVLFLSGNYQDAIKEASLGDYVAHYHFCIKIVEHELYQAGVDCFSTLIPKLKDYEAGTAKSYQQRGFCFWKLRKLNDAVSDYKAALSHSYDPLFELEYCELLIQMNNYDEAEKAFMHLNKDENRKLLQPENHGRFNRVLDLIRKNDSDKTMSLISNALL